MLANKCECAVSLFISLFIIKNIIASTFFSKPLSLSASTNVSSWYVCPRNENTDSHPSPAIDIPTYIRKYERIGLIITIDTEYMYVYIEREKRKSWGEIKNSAQSPKSLLALSDIVCSVLTSRTCQQQ